MQWCIHCWNMNHQAIYLNFQESYRIFKLLRTNKQKHQTWPRKTPLNNNSSLVFFHRYLCSPFSDVLILKTGVWCSSECTHWTLPTNQSKTKLHMTAYNPKLAGSRARSGQPGNRGGDDRAAAWFFPPSSFHFWAVLVEHWHCFYFLTDVTEQFCYNFMLPDRQMLIIQVRYHYHTCFDCDVCAVESQSHFACAGGGETKTWKKYNFIMFCTSAKWAETHATSPQPLHGTLDDITLHW